LRGSSATLDRPAALRGDEVIRTMCEKWGGRAMGDARSMLSVGGDEKSVRIARVIGEVMRQRTAGAAADDAVVEQQHPDLMPELGERLRVLRAIEVAAQQAEERQPSSMSVDPGYTGLEEDLCFLRKALVNYEILERVSYGGQGVVYKAVQRSTQRTVAIKVLLDGPLASKRQRHRFAREAELISRLEHPNIVTLYESGFVRGRPFFAMEYVDGVPIDDYVLLHSLSIVDTVRLFVGVCRAVSHAHQQGVIHRDLNPSNVLVDLDGIPHILDFGLAKDVWTADAVDAQSLLTMTGQVLGTLPYLSPEQAGAEDGRVDVRSDIYSLAIVLFQLLSGGFPYPVDEDPAAVRTNIISREPLPLRKALPPDRSTATPNAMIRDLEVILRKALSKEKALRYQSAAALADDLERCLRGDAVEARAASRLYLLRRTLRKYRVAVAAAALLLLVLSVSTVAVLVLWLDARTQRDSARSMARLAFGTLDDVVTKVDDAVSPLAGGMEVRDTLLNRVVADRLAEMGPLVESDATMEDLRAALHEKQGDIAYAAGHHAEAAEHYQASLDICRALAGDEPWAPEQQQELARAYRKLARVSADAVAHFERAVEIGRQIVGQSPGDADATYALCEALVEFGRHLHRIGHYERAAAQLDDALSAARSLVGSNGEDERWNALLAKAHEWDGEVRMKLGEGERGIHSLTEALRLHRELSQARPADVDRRHRVLITCGRLGVVLYDEGRFEEARLTLEEAVSAGQYLITVDPTVATWKRDLFSAHYRLARLSLEEEELEQAELHCDAALDLGERLVARESDNPTWRGILAYAYTLRGQVLLERNQPEKAHDDFQKALTIREELCSACPDDLTFRERLAASHAWLGRCSIALGRPQHVLDHYQRAHDIAQALFAMQPEVTQRAVEVIRSKTNLAVGHMQFDTPEGNEMARTLLEEACTSLDHLRDSGRLAGRLGTYDSWRATIRGNLTLLAKRAEQGTEPRGSSSSPQELHVPPAAEP
jgi:tetratricopeptide (TPR) repeat protein/tRNA A-37 threonylcarbamoyl transferase component Bud32